MCRFDEPDELLPDLGPTAEWLLVGAATVLSLVGLVTSALRVGAWANRWRYLRGL